jgi:hypothetical protein
MRQLALDLLLLPPILHYYSDVCANPKAGNEIVLVTSALGQGKWSALRFSRLGKGEITLKAGTT